MMSTISIPTNPRLVRLAHCQVPVPIAEVYGVPKSKILISSTDLRPSAQLLADLGLALVFDQYYSQTTTKEDLNLRRKRGVHRTKKKKKKKEKKDKKDKKFIRTSSSDSGTESASSSDSESSLDLDELLPRPPVNYFKALNAMGITTRKIHESHEMHDLWSDVMQNCVHRLSWRQYNLYKCKTCSFKADTQTAVLKHMDGGHVNTKKLTITCAYPHKSRVTLKPAQFLHHMLHVHHLEVPAVTFLPESVVDVDSFVPASMFSFQQVLTSSIDFGALRPMPTDNNLLFFRDDLRCARLCGRLVPKFLLGPNPNGSATPPGVARRKTLLIRSPASPEVLDSNVPACPVSRRKTLLVRPAPSDDPNSSAASPDPEEPPPKRLRQALLSFPTPQQNGLVILEEPPPPLPTVAVTPLSAPVTAPVIAPAVFRPSFIAMPSQRCASSLLASRGLPLFRRPAVKPEQSSSFKYKARVFCELCNSVTTDRLSLADHFKLKHNRSVMKTSVESVRTCNDCGKKFWTAEGLESHAQSCAEGPTLVCPVCDKRFRKHEIYTHVATHHQVHFDQWFSEGRCFLCNNPSSQPLNLVAHWAAVHQMKLVTCSTVHGKKNVFVPINGQPYLNAAQHPKTPPPPPPPPPSKRLPSPQKPPSPDSPPSSPEPGPPERPRTSPKNRKSLRCPKPFCRRSFENRDEQIRHLIHDHSKQQRRCHLCPDFSAGSALAWNEHMQENHPDLAPAPTVDLTEASPKKRAVLDRRKRNKRPRFAKQRVRKAAPPSKTFKEQAGKESSDETEFELVIGPNAPAKEEPEVVVLSD